MKLNYNYIDSEGNYAPKRLVVDDRVIINPTEEQYIKAGYSKAEPAEPHEPSEEEMAEQQRMSRIEK